MYGYDFEDHLVLNQRMVHLWQEEDGEKIAEAWVLPEFGANFCRYKVHGVDYLYPAPEVVTDTRHYGTPVLYPFPGVIKGEKFSFDETLYRFPANRGNVYRHGFVMGEKFHFSNPAITDEGITLKTSISIKRDHPLYSLFPIANRLDLDFTLSDTRLKIHATVTNRDPIKRFPFGLGFHPYINIVGGRENTTVQVPMQHWLDPETGELKDPAASPADLRKPTSLAGLTIDEAWWGMTPERPHSLSFHAIGKKLSIYASDIFTHSVTYTPEGESYFCIENWTSSHDAHNMAAAGKQDAAHLMVLNPNEVASGQIEFVVEDLA